MKGLFLILNGKYFNISAPYRMEKEYCSYSDTNLQLFLNHPSKI